MREIETGKFDLPVEVLKHIIKLFYLANATGDDEKKMNDDDEKTTDAVKLKNGAEWLQVQPFGITKTAEIAFEVVKEIGTAVDEVALMTNDEVMHSKDPYQKVK